MNNYDVVKKLIGPIVPLGQSHTDNTRYNNLVEATELVSLLLYDLGMVAQMNKHPQASIQKAGKHAAGFLAEVHLAGD